MIGYPIVFRCCECTVEEQTMEHLEKHIWSRHLQAFPFKCAHCDYPAINSNSLLEHFQQDHADVIDIAFKRNLEDEKKFRKMIAESIAFEIDESVPTHENPQIAVIEAIPQVTRQIMILPPTSNEYEGMVEHRHSDEEDFGVLEDDDNVEEITDEEEDEESYMDSLGNPVFIGAHDDPDYILEDDLEPPTQVRPPTSYHMKYLRTRRMDKLIENVVMSSSRRRSPDSSKNQINDLINDDAESRTIGRFSCNQCSRTFKFHSKLKEHLRTHVGARPFACQYCDREFTQKGAMKTHERLHTGERPYVCQWECGRQFASASARRQHEKTHSGERPYICSVCGKCFTKNSHVLRHLKNIHSREMMTHAVILPGNEQSDAAIPLPCAPDITPRGQESKIVESIVEQIHEEVTEKKNFV
ncbi:unnamed protein product [Caenorhabditis sp. 36 PRJEB53466]|nr:unnamed protein product [Caenorhabditis sp. 36 PRJEB53466]